MRFILFIFPFVVLYITVSARTKSHLRVIGGEDADINEYPYVVRIEVQKDFKEANVMPTPFTHVCTASMITPTWVLTAAHCFIDLARSKTLAEKARLQYFIRYGSLSSSTVVKMVQIFRHPTHLWSQYPIPQLHNDIALVQTMPVNLQFYARISGLDYEALYGYEVKLFGYGFTNTSSNTIDTTDIAGKPLQMLRALAVKCDNERRTTIPLYPMMCISRRCDIQGTVCPGDSGGPSIHMSGIVGVSSATISTDCTLAKNYKMSHATAFITPVSSFIGWIRRTIEENSTT